MTDHPDFSAAPAWYDLHAEVYRQAAETCRPQAEWDIFLKDLPPRSRILDVGCGTGRDFEVFRAAGHRVSGLEPSGEMRRIARARLGACVRLRAERLQEFQDPEGSWDGIWAMASLLHIPAAEQATVVANLFQSLVPGGRLYACWKLQRAAEAPEQLDAQGRPVCAMSFPRAEEIARRIAPGGVKVWPSIARSSSGQDTAWLNMLLRKG